MLKFFVFLCVSFSLAQALECGIKNGDTNKDLKKVISTCLAPTVPTAAATTDNQTKTDNSTDENGPEDAKENGPRRGMNKRNKRANKDDKKEASSTTTTENPSSGNTTEASKTDGDSSTEDAKKCVALCLLEHFDMLGDDGLPNLEKVSAGLLQSTEQRELKDFLQDSADQCFQEMDKGEKLEACAFSAKLVTCLADKGKSNCADWPVGELPFPHKF